MMSSEMWKKDKRAVLSRAHHDYEQALKRHSFFKLGNQALGNDLVQDTFIKTWSYLVKGGKIEVMKAFLYHVLNNLIVDEYRKRKSVSLDLLLEKGFEPSAVDQLGKFSDLLDGKKAALLIQKLPEKYRRVITMRYVQDLTLKEISLITGLSKNTITVQAYRGLEKLKVLYFASISNGPVYP